MMSKLLSIVIILLMFSWPAELWAEESDPFAGRLLSLEVVMHFRSQINLSKKQSDEIGKLVVSLQKSVAEKQWQMQSAYFQLIEELDKVAIDETTTLDLVEEAVTSENVIKLEQIRFLIRLRNLLTEQQIVFLRERLDEGWVEP